MTGVREEFNLENLKNVFKQNSILGSLIFFFLFSLGNLIFIPGWIFLAAAILVLGYIPGYFLTLGAAIFSCTFSFFLIRFIGKDSMRTIPNKWIQKLLLHLDKNPIKAVTVLRIISQTGPPLNYALAISGIRFKDYLLGCLIGLPIPILIYTFFIDQVIKIMG